MKILSPITNNEAIFKAYIPVKKIVDQYNEIGIDVKPFFKGIDLIKIYQCPDTKFRFYYPFVEGNESFYDSLQKLDIYYLDWKWENEIALNFIADNSKVLDVGCGEGCFLDRIKQVKNCDVTGLESNQNAIDSCKSKGISALKISIQEFSKENVEKFDVVCLFQVLEHIVNVKDFLDSITKVMKKDSTLIIGVPNNKPYIFYRDMFHTLNLPPHHISLWNKESLIAIADYFALEQISIVEEPSKDYLHFYTAIFFKFLSKQTNSSFLTTIYSVLYKFLSLPLISGFYKLILKMISPILVGHTVVAVYQKK